MKKRYFILLLGILAAVVLSCKHKTELAVFDVHLHGDQNPKKQLEELEKNGVTFIAISTSWASQQQYQSSDKLKILHGLMFPCPNGKVPYSLQVCFADGKEWPDLNWVEKQIKEKRIDFLGEILSQYHGISASDSTLFPYYSLAEKYDIPVGIHTGSAGPNHGCPNFKEELGNPILFKKLMASFPKLKLWLMHAGGPFTKETIHMLHTYPGIYIDISVLNNPAIIPSNQFSEVMKILIDNGMEDRILFGSDNAKISETIASINKLSFLTKAQKDKIFIDNSKKLFKIK
nr:amidohydrolase family protein [Pedobacter kyonggii]